MTGKADVTFQLFQGCPGAVGTLPNAITFSHPLQ